MHNLQQLLATNVLRDIIVRQKQQSFQNCVQEGHTVLKALTTQQDALLDTSANQAQHQQHHVLKVSIV